MRDLEDPNQWTVLPDCGHFSGRRLSALDNATLDTLGNITRALIRYGAEEEYHQQMRHIRRAALPITIP